ncbi:MAG: lytic transglycosylase domain-containing protein [Rhodoferax sp.]|uniref:lytic transglycosylase domain-containing protein n=1 Tax=Rhodoferax sp. TaxID=50421 RepID=UPI002623B523|nr:lytic transglycosylase domain-containing protein [Rhodoferax sp.]MDD2879693.1 lytic transglycosylase domain-containing protein [Rhodoferax sp.]
MKIVSAFLFVVSLVLFACMPPTAHAEPVSAERVAAVQWVKENSSPTMSDAKLKKIVSNVWATAHLNDINPLLVMSVIKTESNFKENTKSFYGAKGLMQVVPRFHRDKLKGRNPYDAHTSIEVGTQILKDCWDKSRRNLKAALQCYSGGGGKKYYKKVVTNHAALKTYLKDTQQSEVKLSQFAANYNNL